MKRLWFIPIFLALAGFSGLRMTGGSFAPVPPTPILITFSPTNPSIADNFVNGTQVASVLVTMSNGSAFNGSLGFSPPVTSGCAQNGNNSGLFGTAIPPTYALLTTRTGSSADDGTKLATVTATQNGGTVCAVVSILVQPANVVPPPAAVAGFNQLIINDDFQSATFANPSTWLDCNDGSAPPASPLYWRAWVGFGMNISVPCSQITQAVDPVGGQLALRLHNQDSFRDLTNGHSMAAIVQTTDNNGNGRRIPQGHYVEVEARTDLSTRGSPNPWMGLWSYSVTNASNGNYELDGAEEAGSGVSFAIHNFSAPGNGNCAPTNYCSCANPDQACAPGVVDVTQYHTYAWRQTGAGSDLVMCAYIDGVKQGACNTIDPNSSQLSPGSDMVVQLFNTGATNALGNGSTGKNVWVRKLKVFSCAGINSGQLCHSSINNP